MARNVLALLATLVLGVQGGAANAVDAAREERSISGFDRIVWRGVGELLIEQTGRESLVVEAEQRLLPNIITEVKTGVLHIGFAPGSFSTRHPIRFHLTVRSLGEIRSSTSGDITVKSIKSKSFLLDMAGSGDARIDELVTDKLAIRITGSSNVSIARGTASSQSIEIRGSGSYLGARFLTNETNAHIAGSGDIEVMATTSLDANVSGSGDVRYGGNPRVTESISGSGSVRPLQSR